MGNAVIHQRLSESIYADSCHSSHAVSDMQYYSTNYKSNTSSTRVHSSFPKPRRASRPYSIIKQNLKDALKLHHIVKEINSRNQTNSRSVLVNNTHLNYASAYSSSRHTQGDQTVMSLTSLMQQQGIDSGIFRASPAMSVQRNLPLPANNENLERSNNFRHENSHLALQDRSNSSPHIQTNHHLINKAYKAVRSSRRQESGRDKHLPTPTPPIEQILEDSQQIINSESNISSLNNTEERPMKRRICFKSKSANKYAPKPNFNAQDFLNELENLRSTKDQPQLQPQQFHHCSPNDSYPISRQGEEAEPTKTENPLRSRPQQNFERTPSPHRNIQEYNTQSSGKSRGSEPAVKHRVLVESNSKNKREKSYEESSSAQKQRHYYGIKAFSPPPISGQRSSSPFQDLRSKSPLEYSQRETSPSPFKETGKYSNRSGVYTQILSKHYDLSDIQRRFQGSNSKRLNSSSPSPNDKRRPMQNYEQPTLSQVQRINFSHLGSATKSSLMSYTDDEERREDRLLPIQHVNAVRKQEDYRAKTPPHNLTGSATKSVHMGDFNIDTRQLLLSVEKKASTLNLQDLAQRHSRSNSPLQKLSSSYNSNNVLRDSNTHQQENCNSVLSDINLKIEGILQKCCELTEKSAKGLEKLNSSRSFRKGSTTTMERGASDPVANTANTANTVNTQDTGRGDTARDHIRLTSEESTADFRKHERNYWSAASIDNNEVGSQRIPTEEQNGKEFEDVLAEDRIVNRGLSQKRHGETIIEEEEEASKDMMYLESHQRLEHEGRYNSSPVHNNHEGVYSVYSDIVVKEPESVWNTSSGLGQLIFTSEQSSHLMSFGSVKKNQIANFRSRGGLGKNEDYLSSHIYTDELNSTEGVKKSSSHNSEQQNNIAVKVEAAISSANCLQAQVNARDNSQFPSNYSESLTKEKLEKEIFTAVHELESISKVLKTLPANNNNDERFVSAVGLEQVQTVLMQKIGAIHEDILTRIEQLNQKIESKSSLSTRRKSSAAVSQVSIEPATKPNTRTEVDIKLQSMNISDFEAIHGHQSFLNQSSLPKPDSARSTVYIQSQTLNHSTHQDQAKAFEPVLTFGSIKAPSSGSREDVKRMQKSKSQSKYEPKQVNISIPKIMEHATSRSTTTKTNRRDLDHMAMLKDVSPISHKNDMLKGSLFEDVSLIGRSGRSTEKGSISNIKRDASTNTEKTVESLPINEDIPKPTMPQVHMFGGAEKGETKKVKSRDLGEKKWSNEKLRNGFSKYMKTIYGEDHFNDAGSLVVQTEPGYDEMNGNLTSVYEERYLNLLNRELRQKNLKRYSNMDNSDYHDLAFEKQILAAKYHTFAQYEEKDSSQPEQQSPSPEHTTVKSEGVASEKKKLAVDLMSLSSMRRNRDLETPDENIQKLEEWLDGPAQTQNQKSNRQQQQQNGSLKGKNNSNKDHRMKVLKIQNLIKQAQGKSLKDDNHHQGSLFYTEGNEVEDLSWLDASNSRINRSSVLSNKLSNYDPNRSNSRDNGRLSVTSSKGKAAGMMNRGSISVKKGDSSGKKASGMEKNSGQKSTDRRSLLKNVYLESLGSVSSFEVGRENRGGMSESRVKQNNNSKKTSETPEKKGASAKKVVGKSGEKKRFEEIVSEDRIRNFGMVRKY